MTSEKMARRIAWIDNAKAIGILLVIFGHSYNCRLTSWIYSFHMPLFFFLSGLTFRPGKSFAEFAKHKAKRLLLPYLGYAVLRFAYQCVLALAAGNANLIPRYALGVFICLRNSDYSVGLWFLPLLFFTELLLFGIMRLTGKEILRFAILAGLTMASFAYCAGIATPLPFGIDVVPISALFAFAGFLLRSRGGSIPKGWAVVLLVVNILAGWFNSRIVGTNVDLYYSRLGNPILYLVAAFGGIFAVVALCRMWNRSPEIIERIGRNTLHFYCIHQMLIDLLRRMIEKATGFAPSASSASAVFINLALLAVCIVAGLIWCRILCWFRGKKGELVCGKSRG